MPINFILIRLRITILYASVSLHTWHPLYRLKLIIFHSITSHLKAAGLLQVGNILSAHFQVSVKYSAIRNIIQRCSGIRSTQRHFHAAIADIVYDKWFEKSDVVRLQRCNAKKLSPDKNQELSKYPTKKTRRHCETEPVNESTT